MEGASEGEKYKGTFYELKEELVDTGGERLMRFLFDEDELAQMEKKRQFEKQNGHTKNRSGSGARHRKRFRIRSPPKGSLHQLIKSFNCNPETVKTFSVEDKRRTVKTTANMSQSVRKKTQITNTRWGVNTKIKQFFRPKSAKNQFKGNSGRNSRVGLNTENGVFSNKKMNRGNVKIRSEEGGQNLFCSSSSQRMEKKKRLEKVDMRHFIGTSKACVNGKANLVGQKLENGRRKSRNEPLKRKIDDYFMSNRVN